MIDLIDPKTSELLMESAEGLCDSKGDIVYPLLNGAYRLVSDENYASNFGFEWNSFQKTQIDKYSGNDASKKRFFAETRWNDDLADQNILEVGSGAGRFSQIILDFTKAILYSLDYSNAVEANFKNNGPNERLKLFQASIYDMPFRKGCFDKVVCLGVLQHTPDFKRSIQCLVDMVKPGGELVVDFYPVRGWYTKISAKYLLRPLTKKMNNERLSRMIKRNIDWMIKLYRFNEKIHLGILNRFIPICDISRTLPGQFTDKDLREWIILDTFDMFSPEYDNPQKLNKVAKWLKEFGMEDIDAGFVRYDSQLEAATVKAKKSQ